MHSSKGSHSLTFACSRDALVTAFPSNGFARLAGTVGSRRRWAKYPPGSPERAEQMAKVRAAQHERYIERARAVAAERGLSPTDAQLAEAARLLRLSDLAEYRLKAWNALNGASSTSGTSSRSSVSK
jgi:hypothetical protein